MTPELADRVVASFITTIRIRLQEALAVARAAEAYLEAGRRSGALQIALGIEEPCHDATTLLDASAIVDRLARSVIEK